MKSEDGDGGEGEHLEDKDEDEKNDVLNADRYR